MGHTFEVTAENVDQVSGLMRDLGSGSQEAYQTLIQLGSRAKLTFDENGELSSDRDASLDLAAFYDQGLLTTTTRMFSDTSDLLGKYVADAAGAWTWVNEENIDQFSAGSYSVLTGLDQSAIEETLEQADAWENSLDWLYNINKQLARILRERNKLEEEENRVLKSQNERVTATALLDNLA